MGDELRVPASTLAEIQGELARGRAALERAGSSAPAGLDAGDMSAMLGAMMAKVVDNAAALSEGLAAVGSQVGEAGTTFWEVDAVVATSYGGKEVPVAH